MLLCGLFAPQRAVAQSSKHLTLYTNALKRYLIYGDTLVAKRLVNQALESDSTYMPAQYLLSRLEKDPQRAWQAAEKAAAADTTNHHLLMQVGELSLRAQQYERTKQVLTKLIKDSHNQDHFRLLALLHNMSKNRSQAHAVLDSAEVRFGKQSYFNRLRQQIYLDEGEFEKALNSAMEGVKQAPYEPENHIALAGVYAAAGVDSLADKSFNEALVIDKQDPSLWFEYARYLDSRGRHNDLMMVWRSVMDLDRVPLDAKISIVESLTSKRDFYRKHFLLIEPIINRLYQLYPDNKVVEEQYITHLIAANRIEEALQMLKSKFAGQQPTPEQLGKVIDIETYLDRRDSVEYYVDRGIELYPDQENFWFHKIWLQSRRGDDQNAITTIKSALKQLPDPKIQSSLWGSLGDTYYTLEENKRSEKCYKKAISIDPENAVALNNYAYHLSVEGKMLDLALEMSQKANKLLPNNATHLDTLAWIYYKRGEFEKAKQVMQQAMSFDTNKSAELALHYGDILEALGSTFMAQTYWRMALERGASAEIIERRIEAQKERINSQKSGQQ